MKVSRLLSEKQTTLQSASHEETIQSVARRLLQDDVGAVIVTGGDRDFALTETEIVRGIGQHGPVFLSLQASSVDSGEGVSCGPDDSLSSVAQAMTRHRVSVVPVLEDGRIVGIVSAHDVLRCQLSERRQLSRRLVEMNTARR